MSNGRDSRSQGIDAFLAVDINDDQNCGCQRKGTGHHGRDVLAQSRVPRGDERSFASDRQASTTIGEQ